VALLLLRADHRIGREELAEILFADLTPDRAANAVAKALSMARSALGAAAHDGGQILQSDRGAIWIDSEADVYVDLDDHMAALGDALELTGASALESTLAVALRNEQPLLPDEPYADWAVVARDRLATRRLEARLAEARARTAAAQWPGEQTVIDAWAGVLARDPTNEEACAGMMAACAAGGQRDRAIRAYHRCRLALRDELDVEPSATLERSYATVVDGEALADVPIPTAGPIVPAHAAPALFGRGRQLRRVRQRLAETSSGRGSTVAVLGPAGIGKTRLLEVLLHGLEADGWLVLQGTAVPADRLLPYAALRSALRPLLRGLQLPDGSLLALLANEAAEGSPGRTADLDGEDLRAQLADELADLLKEVSADRPIALVVDDLQWADRSLQGVLLRLGSAAGPRRWALVVGARTDEPGTPLPALARSAERIELAPLSERATRQTVRHVLTGRRLSRPTLGVIVERSKGNPFFAVELARQADARPTSFAGEPDGIELPTAIAQLLRSRLDACSPMARRLLPVVALAGNEARYEVLLRIGADEALAGSTEAAVRALENLLGAQLLEERTDGLRLVHPLLREAALLGVNALRRAAIHTRIADALDALIADGDGRWRDAAARHRLAAFQSGGLRETARVAAQAALEAGNRARLIFADEAAANLFRGGLAAFEALSGEEREELRPLAVAAAVQLGHVVHDAEGDGAAEEAFRVALSLAGNDDERARAWSAIGGIAYRHGDLTRAVAIYEQGMNSLVDVGSAGAARLRTDLGWCYYRTGRGADALSLIEQVASSTDLEADPDFGGLVLDRMAMALSTVDRLAEAVAVIDRALEVANLPGGERVRPVVLVHRALLLQAVGRLRDAFADVRAAQRMFAAGRERYAQAMAHWTASDLLAEIGDLEGALAERDAETELLLEIDNARHLATNQAGRSRLLHALGRDDEGRAAAEAARVAAQRSGDARIQARVARELQRLQAGRE
jgi:DNA-binding SARP family transcriptional activator/tetratricopeptide (TPR) repeat protein